MGLNVKGCDNLKQKTEMSERPSDFTLTVEGEKTIVTFYTDVEEIQREGETKETAYMATAWTMTVPTQDSLKERIEKNPDLWLAKVKTLTAAEEADAELARLEETATDDAVCDLASVVSDLVDAVSELATMIVEGE